MFSLCRKLRKFAGHCELTLYNTGQKAMWLSAHDSVEAELLPVSRNKLPFFSIEVTATAGKNWPFCLIFEGTFLPSYFKRGAGHCNLQLTGYLLKTVIHLSFQTFFLAGRPVNPLLNLECILKPLDQHQSVGTWSQCASFQLLDFWHSMSSEKVRRLMLVARRPMMLLGASCLFLIPKLDQVDPEVNPESILTK